MTSTTDHVLAVTAEGRVRAVHLHDTERGLGCVGIDLAVRRFAEPLPPHTVGEWIRNVLRMPTPSAPPPGYYRIELAEDGNLDIGGRLRLDEAERISVREIATSFRRSADELEELR